MVSSEEMKKKDKMSSTTSTPFSNNVFMTFAIVGIFIHLIFALYYVPSYQTCSEDYQYNDTKLAHIKKHNNGDHEYRFVVITDLDHHSKVQNSKKPKWESYMKYGKLIINKQKTSAKVFWDDGNVISISSDISAGGRGMELSDLAVFDGNLITVDDRTGLLYKIIDNKAYPWIFLNDGPGNTLKGIKGEWMTVKDKHLYVGGLGKEWTTTEGVFVNYHPMFVKVISPSGSVKHLNWTDNFINIRDAVGIKYPGYMIHESVQWSDVHHQWFFMPRRASNETYTEATDEFMGTNYMIIADEDFTNIKYKKIGKTGDGSRGYSAFQFVPETNDDIIVTLKSEEKDGVPVASYLSVYCLSTEKVILDETPLSGTFKYEGIEFV
ncbi:Soluble calcium-activated nucleotidase 1 [Strongyloides ratti]|uniref:Soluble calcium-activated nucleotidase 1 n=1 Tax=Strongyloides ratti TaxID=34506 RepID=A0A090MVN1_STRRB|nr:Soluble calcium-activated nucleotidase 1 [Strongyloides ratti]CEF63008.1 Soluble calcium-activated nucleotidase 1 [Strongyloides ratti]